MAARPAISVVQPEVGAWRDRSCNRHRGLFGHAAVHNPFTWALSFLFFSIDSPVVVWLTLLVMLTLSFRPEADASVSMVTPLSDIGSRGRAHLMNP